jgi:hypothetical protein
VAFVGSAGEIPAFPFLFGEKMGCQTEVELGANLTFTVTTHDPATAAVTDAAAVPEYFVYEDETGASILNGTMTILDNANTTGFYSELIACTAANGFEAGRSYNIYIEATVNGVAGAISYGFRVADASEPAPGAIEFTYTVTNSATGLPIEGVEVWITTDAAGTNVVWHGDTDVFGVARDGSGGLPWLDAGDYFFFCQRAGFTFVNPDLENVA